MGWLFGRSKEKSTQATAESSPEKEFEMRDIAVNDSATIDAACKLITQSWSEEELAGFDLKEELQDPETYRLGIFEGPKLIGFAAANSLASPDFSPGSKYPQGKDMWIGYFVVDENFRKNPKVFSKFRTMLDKLLQVAKSANKERILACTENDAMRSFLEKQGWHFVEQTDIVDKFGKHIAPTNVFEYQQK